MSIPIQSIDQKTIDRVRCAGQILVAQAVVPISERRTERKNMKRPSSVFVTLCVVAVFAGGCSTTSSNTSAASEKPRLLAEAGFQLRTVTNPKHQQRLAQLPQDRVSTVKYHRRIYFVYPMPATNQVYVGNRAQYHSYLQLLGKEQARIANAATMPKPVLTEEVPGPGPNPILIEEYEDWSPLLGTE